MEKIISLVVAAYGAYILYSGNVAGLTPIELGKGLSAVVAGGGYFTYLNMDSVKAVISNILTKTNKKPVVEVPAVNNACSIFNPNDYEQKDFECLVHLRNRVTAAANVEGMETCARLNEIIFSLEVASKAAKVKELK